MKMTSSTLDLMEVKPDLFIPVASLKHWLPDVETALFFAKAYKLDYRQLSELIQLLFHTPVIDALMSGEHSTELQDYIVDVVPDDMGVEAHGVVFTEDMPAVDTELLGQIWESLELKVAASIQEVADSVKGLLSHMPGKEGQMLFEHMSTLNRQRNTIGDYKAYIHHEAVPNVLVVFDVSGSMTEEVVTTIVTDVVGLSYNANAHLAIVSNSYTHWAPGAFSVDAVLAKAEYGGTHYEMLLPLLEQDWDVVITIADYDSSRSAKHVLAKATGRIGKVLDVSLVDRPTFLAECLGQLADEVQPLLIARNVVNTYGW